MKTKIFKTLTAAVAVCSVLASSGGGVGSMPPLTLPKTCRCPLRNHAMYQRCWKLHGP